jgi:hypothetical protein
MLAEMRADELDQFHLSWVPHGNVEFLCYSGRYPLAGVDLETLDEMFDEGADADEIKLAPFELAC